MDQMEAPRVVLTPTTMAIPMIFLSLIALSFLIRVFRQPSHSRRSRRSYESTPGQNRLRPTRTARHARILSGVLAVLPHTMRLCSLTRVGQSLSQTVPVHRGVRVPVNRCRNGQAGFLPRTVQSVPLIVISCPRIGSHCPVCVCWWNRFLRLPCVPPARLSAAPEISCLLSMIPSRFAGPATRAYCGLRTAECRDDGNQKDEENGQRNDIFHEILLLEFCCTSCLSGTRVS